MTVKIDEVQSGKNIVILEVDKYGTYKVHRGIEVSEMMWQSVGSWEYGNMKSARARFRKEVTEVWR